MNQLMNFEFEGRPIRVILRDSEPWWLASEVCEALEIGNTGQAMTRLDEDEYDRVPSTIISNDGGPSRLVVNESGLYELILGSRKPEAKAFKRWIKRDVLPSIRKNGMYVTDQLLDDPEHLLKVTEKLVAERKLRLAAETKLIEQAPLVTFAETCLASKDSILVRELAKVASKNGFNTGEKRLYQKLREWGLILQASTEPSQRAMDAGWFEVIQRPVDTPYGQHLSSTTKVTPKGQVYIIERLRVEANQNGAA